MKATLAIVFVLLVTVALADIKGSECGCRRACSSDSAVECADCCEGECKKQHSNVIPYSADRFEFDVFAIFTFTWCIFVLNGMCSFLNLNYADTVLNLEKVFSSNIVNCH